MAADFNNEEMETLPSPTSCDREFDDITSMLQGMSVDIGNEITSPIARGSFKNISIKKTSDDFEMASLLSCNDEDFKTQLLTLSAIDLDLVILMLQQQIRVNTDVSGNTDVILKRSEDSIDSIETLKLRLTMCRSRKSQKRRTNAGEHGASTEKIAKRPGKPNRFNVRGSATSEEFDSMSAQQLQDLLTHYKLEFDPSLGKNELLTLLLSDVLERVDGEDADWEPPPFNSIDWHSPTALDCIDEQPSPRNSPSPTVTATDDQLYIPNRVDYSEWDPTTILQALFRRTINNKDSNDEVKEKKRILSQSEPVQTSKSKLSGYLEKLPVNQVKAKAFKGWKRRYFSIDEGRLYYFESHTSETPLGSIPLRGSEIKVPGEKEMLLTSQGSRDVITLRCNTISEMRDWYHALHEEAISTQFSKMAPVIVDKEDKLAVIIDLGASSIKAGFNTSKKPKVAFPTVVAVDPDSDEMFHCECGVEAYLPETRKKCKLVFPLRPHLKVDKYSIQKTFIPCLIDKAFSLLKTKPHGSTVIFSCPRYLSDKDKEFILDYMFGNLGIHACYMEHQSLLSLYSYSSTSGVVVDIGDHIDVVPIVEGCIIEAGVASFSYGGQQITESLSKMIAESGNRFFTETQSLIVRYIKEQGCFVNASAHGKNCPPISVVLERFDLPDGTTEIELGTASYRCTEGLFRPDVWGKDDTGLHHNIDRAIKLCDIDARRELCRKIYLTGGTTLLEGLDDRLKSELKSLMASSVSIEIHADPHRHIAAFKGAVTVSKLPTFESVLITNESWKNGNPVELLKKWNKTS